MNLAMNIKAPTVLTVRAVFKLALLFAVISTVGLSSAANSIAAVGNGKIAYLKEDGQPADIYLKNPADGSEQQLTDTVGVERLPTFSPDGRYIAYILKTIVNDRPVHSLRAATVSGEATGLSLALGELPSSIVWSPNGQWLALNGDTSLTIGLLPVSEGQIDQGRIGQASFFHGSGPSWSPDSLKLAFTTSVGEGANRTHSARVRDLASGETSLLFNNNRQVLELYWSALNKIAYTEPTADIFVVRAWTSNPDGSDQLLLGDSMKVLSWSPDGSRLAVFKADATRSVSVLEGSTTVATTGEYSLKSNRGAAWSPDSNYLVFSQIPSGEERDGFNEDPAADPTGDVELYTLDTRSGQKMRLTDNSIGDYQPSWQRVEVPDAVPQGDLPPPSSSQPTEEDRPTKTEPEPKARAMAKTKVVISKRGAYRKGRLSVRLRCKSPQGRRCFGYLKLSGKSVSLGRVRFSIKAGKSAQIKLKPLNLIDRRTRAKSKLAVRKMIGRLKYGYKLRLKATTKLVQPKDNAINVSRKTVTLKRK